MIPKPMNPTASAKSATSRRLDPKSLTRPQATARLRRQRLAVEQVAPARAGLPALRARRRVATPLGEEREAHRLARLDLPHDAVPAPAPPRSTRSPAHGVGH